MVNTKILLSVVIVLIIGIAAASVQMNSDSPSLWSFTNPQDTADQSQNTQSGQTQAVAQDGTSASDQSGDGGDNVKISTTKAKSIAQNSIEQPDAKAGTPELTTMNGEKVYVVPVIDKGEKAGEIWIDAQTGKVIGGAGGAP